MNIWISTLSSFCLLHSNMKEGLVIQEKPVFSIFYLLVIILVLPDASIGEPRAQTIRFSCSPQVDHSSTGLVAFTPTFFTTIDNITDQIRISGYGASISGGGRNSNTSYGLSQCYGDLSPIDCVLCFAEARVVLFSRCFPSTGGKVFLDGCFMRAENYNFFQEITGPQDRAVCGNQTKKDSAFQELARRAVLQSVTVAASRNGSARAELQSSTNLNEYAYVLADCWKSLNSDSCRACLENASESILGCLPWSEGRATNTGCFMRYSDTNFLNRIPTRPSRVISQFPMAKPGCRDTCGNNVTIPYPFGIGSGCALNELYTISCVRKSANLFQNDLQTPFLNVNGNEYEVLKVSLRDQTLTVTAPVGNASCFGDYLSPNSSGMYDSANLEGTPFFYSNEYNRLVLLGCGNALLHQNPAVGRSKLLSGCTSTCLLTGSESSSCFGINCCQTDIPLSLRRYWINFTATETSDADAPKCTTAILVDKKWKPEDDLFLPVVWSWTLQDPSETNVFLGCSRISSSLELESGNVSTYGCECKAFGSLTWYHEINPYLNGSCDHAASVLNVTRNNAKVAIVSAAVGFGTLFLMTAFFTSFKMIKKWRKKKQRERFFKQNGGLLLQKQLSRDEGVVGKTNIFSEKELKKASDGFNANRVLGEGGQGTVYKGMLTDGRIVAIKKSKKVGKSQLEEFINEVVILSQVNHRNVVKVLGCCLEAEVPLLVYEYIPNGNLFNLIHNDSDREFPLTWSIRLRIIMEVASALAYLHSSISTPVFHKDIKSSNILLDERYTSKVSDFGTSRSVAIDKTHLTTRVQGTFGYFDPEYFQSGRFTDKSDVYSFGVVLIELLTRQKPTSAGPGEDSDLGLARSFMEFMEKGAPINTILDPQIIDDKNVEDEIVAAARLAQRCVDLNGRRRPTMKEVVGELERIKMSKQLDSFPMEVNSPSNGSYIEEEFGRHTWTYDGEIKVSSASQSIPLMFDTI